MSEAIQAGVFDGMPAEEYFAIPALSNSGMKDLAVSPLRYWHLHVNPQAPEREETAAQRIGTALHCSVLEGDQAFDARYACALNPDEWVMKLDTIAEIRQWITDNGGKPKGTRKDEVIDQALGMMLALGESVPIVEHEKRVHAAQNAGRVILSVPEWNQVSGMTHAITREPAIQEILSEGRPEVSVIAKDPETGVHLKCRIDWLSPKITFDTKSFTQMRGNSIDKSVTNALYYEGYLEQAYFYRMLRKLATGKTGVPFVFGFVESDQPHEVRIKTLNPSNGIGSNVYWEVAGANVRKLIRLYAKCWQEFGDKPWRTQQDAADLTDEEIPQLAYGGFK